jgi:TldD protein
MTVATSPTPLLQTNDLLQRNYSSTRERFDASWEASLSTLLGLGRAAGADFIEFFPRAHQLHQLSGRR